MDETAYNMNFFTVKGYFDFAHRMHPDAPQGRIYQKFLAEIHKMAAPKGDIFFRKEGYSTPGGTAKGDGVVSPPPQAFDYVAIKTQRISRAADVAAER